MFLLAQIPAPASGSIENWLLSAAAIGSMAVLAKKLFFSKQAPHQELLTKSEFHTEMKDLREKMDTRFLMLLQKLSEAKAELLHHLNDLDASVARLDERTKK